MLDAGQLIGGVARHLMVQVDRWQESGFGPVGDQFLARLAATKGVTRAISANGDLIERGPLPAVPGERRLPLLEALRTPQWQDPLTGEPWA